jgi:flagellar hook-associated protein 2
MGSSLTSPVTVTFNGTSQYAQSLQQVIARSVNLAALPLHELQNEQITTSTKISAAQSLQSVLTSLQTALQGLPDTSNNNTLSSTVSNSTVIDATASSGALPGTYTIDVTDPGSHSTAISLDALPKVTDPASQDISTSSAFTLTVGANTFNIHPSANNLDSLAAAINASGAGVQATIINIGAPSQPDYRIAFQATDLGAEAIQLNDGSSDLLQMLSTGNDAVYTVNGQPAGGISSTSSTVTVAPGLSVNLKAAGSSTIQVALSSSSISNALTAFVNAFNAAQAELKKSFGQNAGPLSGDSTVFSARQALTEIFGYSGSGPGSIQSLTDLGVEFTKEGTLTFDSTKVASFSPSQLADAVSFFGNATSGFTASANSTMNGLLDVTNGLVPSEINSLNNQFNDQAKRIATQQDSISRLADTLTKQMNAADALIASLEQQTSFLTSLFNTMNANNFAGH